MIKYKKDTDNVVTLTLDMDGRPVNLINHEIGRAFIPVLDHLKAEKAKGLLRGVIITSAKRSFLASGDLEYLFQAQDAAEIFGFSEKMKAFLRELERPGVPVVAAINGNAVSIGFEVALACHYRIALNDPQIQLGLPDVKIGMIPGSGGIIRLMWLLGIEKAYEVLASGESCSPRLAQKFGLIDSLAESDRDLLEKAKQWLLSNSQDRRPWDKPNRTVPYGTANNHRVAQQIKILSAKLFANGLHNYTTYQALLQVLAEGSKVDFNTACRIESRYYTKVVKSQTCKNMIKAFWLDTNAIARGTNRPKGFGKFRPKKVGIIGSGQMGSRIAFACASQGIEVILKDVSKLIAERGREYVRSRVKELLDADRIVTEQGDEWIQRIHTADRAQDFESCDLVIEAVFENQMLKKKVTKEAEIVLDAYSILGSNSISIPISKLAEACNRPENYVGLHFFHPADVVPLVEIVKGQKTSEETVARAFDFVRALDKIPIVVKDGWGFYAARVQNTYILEGITMLQEGFPAPLIENLGREAGMPKGALELADDLGLKIVLRYENQAAEHYGSKYIAHPAADVLTKMIKDLDRTGKQKKTGFYSYLPDDQKLLWNELDHYFPATVTTYDRQEIIERFLFAQVIEACWCMQEKVIHSIPAANLGSIYGWGFPAFTGGVIQYVHDYGPQNFLNTCDRLEQKFGRRFNAPRYLKRLVAKTEHPLTSKPSS